MGQVKNSISPEERDLCFRLADGNTDILKKIFELRILCERSRRLPYIQILNWLLQNGLTGHDFIGYLKEKNNGSMLELGKRVRAKIYNDHKLRPLIGRYQI